MSGYEWAVRQHWIGSNYPTIFVKSEARVPYTEKTARADVEASHPDARATVMRREVSAWEAVDDS